MKRIRCALAVAMALVWVVPSALVILGWWLILRLRGKVEPPEAEPAPAEVEAPQAAEPTSTSAADDAVAAAIFTPTRRLPRGQIN